MIYLQKGSEELKQHMKDDLEKDEVDVLMEKFNSLYNSKDKNGTYKEIIDHLEVIDNESERKSFLTQYLKGHISELSCDSRSQLMLDNIKNVEDDIVCVCGLLHFDYIREKLRNDGNLIDCITFNHQNYKEDESNFNKNNLNIAKLIIKRKEESVSQFLSENSCCEIM